MGFFISAIETASGWSCCSVAGLSAAVSTTELRTHVAHIPLPRYWCLAPWLDRLQSSRTSTVLGDLNGMEHQCCHTSVLSRPGEFVAHAHEHV